MANISKKIRSQARRAIRNSQNAWDNEGTANPVRVMTFPFSEGSLVSFRKQWSPWSGRPIQQGQTCIVLEGPYRNDYLQVDCVDVVIDGQILEQVPAKILLNIDAETDD